MEGPAGTLENGLPLQLTTDAVEAEKEEEEKEEEEAETELDKIESPEDRLETRFTPSSLFTLFLSEGKDDDDKDAAADDAVTEDDDAVDGAVEMLR